MTEAREWRVEVNTRHKGWLRLGATKAGADGWDFASRIDAEAEAARYTAEYGTEARAVKV